MQEVQRPPPSLARNAPVLIIFSNRTESDVDLHAQEWRPVPAARMSTDTFQTQMSPKSGQCCFATCAGSEVMLRVGESDTYKMASPGGGVALIWWPGSGGGLSGLRCHELREVALPGGACWLWFVEILSQNQGCQALACMALSSQKVLEAMASPGWGEDGLPQQEIDGLPLTVFAFPQKVNQARTTILQSVFFDSQSRGTEATLEPGGICTYQFSQNVIRLRFQHADGTVLLGYCDPRVGPRRTQSRYTLVYSVLPA